MYKQTLVVDADPAIVRPLCPGGLLVSLPHRPFSRCLLGIWTWQRRLFACRRLTHRSPFRTRLRWPSLWCWTTASAIFCVASALQCGWPSWMTSGLRPAVPQLSAFCFEEPFGSLLASPPRALPVSSFRITRPPSACSYLTANGS